jgi:para-aminobenzoate synthetase/4-amino-4-deoxychorismate lyase
MTTGLGGLGGWSDLLRHRSVGGGEPGALSGRYVLLDDARPGGGAYLFHDPVLVVAAHTAGEVEACWHGARRHLADGKYLAGFLAYPDSPGVSPAMWLGVYEAPIAIDPVRALPHPASTPLVSRPRIAAETYVDMILAAQRYIHAGDIYQANLTFACDVSLTAAPLAHYARLRPAQRAPWGAVVSTGDALHMSCSPELFAATRQGRIWAKPMKGTAKRGRPEDDAQARAALAASDKDRAENLMIVDLMRNDISPVSQVGSVRVDALYEIETYPTVFQMTSTITATLRDGCTMVDLLQAAFPCGSITGAPKRRACEIIAELEPWRRGLYTGAIGYIGPDGDGAFNVAIRTLSTTDGRHAVMGLGAGITAMSDPAAEWDECLAKGAFASA